jgi:transcriptional antiterminator NusG
MNYYALQVETSAEGDFIRRAELRFDPHIYHFFFPKRKLMRQKGGKKFDTIEPVFPGYVFLGTEEAPGPIWYTLRRIEGFYRFLPDNTRIKPMSDRDFTLIKHFMSFGEIADKSKVSFDENDRIVVQSGPLKGYEGHIYKVDRRKGRAWLRLTFCNSVSTVVLGFELLDKLPKGAGSQDGTDKPIADLHNRGGLRGPDTGGGDKA